LIKFVYMNSIIENNPIYYYSLISWIVFGLIIFLILIKFNNIPTYGRHLPKRGILLNNRLGWILMEIPTLVLMPYFTFNGINYPNTVILCFFSIYMIHYINRTLIFPFRISSKKKKIPIYIVISAALFNLCNTFFIGYYFGNIAEYKITWLQTPYFIFGIIIFSIGMYINLKSDTILINLRKNNNDDYKIPFGGLFRYISCPNYFGEILEWLGFAILTWSLSTLAFMLWTCFNLIPRAIKHHNWYKQRFSDYPDKRKVIFPKIL